MKRTASQTFTHPYYDPRDPAMALDAVTEQAAAHPHHQGSLSRALGAVTGSFSRQKTRRRMSSFSSQSNPTRHRRGSIQSFIDSLPSSSSTRKPSAEHQRLPLPHQDSGIPSFQPGPSSPQSGPKPFSLKRFSSMRRRPAAPQPAVEPLVSPFVVQPAPGAAARQAAAAANQDRLNQLRREQEHTHRFLNGLIQSNKDDDLKDNESGVDMTCSSPIVRTDSATEKKKKMSKSPRHPPSPCLLPKLSANMTSRSLPASTCRARDRRSLQPGCRIRRLCRTSLSHLERARGVESRLAQRLPTQV